MVERDISIFELPGDSDIFEDEEHSYGEDELFPMESELVAIDREQEAGRDKEEYGDEEFDNTDDLIRRDDFVRLYFKQMRLYPPLPVEEEVRLVQQMNEGVGAQDQQKISEGKEARQRLILHNMRLVVSIAKRYRDRGVPFSDLIQEGNVGLIRAIDGFDSNLGFRVTTYATWWIKQNVDRACQNQGPRHFLPMHAQEMIRKIQKFQTNYLITNGRNASIEEIGLHLEVLTPDELRRLQHANQEQGVPLDIKRKLQALQKKIDHLSIGKQSSLSLEHSYGDDERELGDVVEDVTSESPFHTVSLKNEIQHHLMILDERARQVVDYYYGLVDGINYSFLEIGKKVGLSEEGARQVHVKALRQMQLNEYQQSALRRSR